MEKNIYLITYFTCLFSFDKNLCLIIENEKGNILYNRTIQYSLDRRVFVSLKMAARKYSFSLSACKGREYKVVTARVDCSLLEGS